MASSGSELQVMWGFEKANGVWQPSDLQNAFPAKSLAGLMAKRNLERVANMHPSRQTLKGIATQAAIAPKVDNEPDVNSLPRMVAHFMRKDPVITPLAAGVEQWVNGPFRRGDDANDRYIDSIFMEATDGDGYPVLVDSIRLAEIGIKIAAGKLNAVSWTFVGGHDTFTSDATELNLAGAFSGVPIIRGHWDQAKVATLKAKVTAAAGAGFVGKIKITTGVTAYGATEITIVAFDKWYRVKMSSDGSRLGLNRKEDLWICIPSTDPATTLTVNDEWSFTAQRTLATATYSDLDPLDAASLEFLVEDEEYIVKDADIKLMNPTVPSYNCGSKYALAGQPNGRVSASIAINRDREDRDFLLRLISAESFSVSAKMYGNPLDATYDELWQLDFPNAQVSDDTRDVTTENTLPESINILPFYDPSTEDDLVTSTIYCGVAGLFDEVES